MNYLGISYDIKNVPVLDQGFIPFGVWVNAYLKEADRPFSVAVERENGKISVFDSFLRGEEFAAANERYVERLVKFLLWSVGGWRVYLTGCDAEAAAVKAAYTAEGKRAFDYGFMQDVYERPFEVVIFHDCTFYLILFNEFNHISKGVLLWQFYISVHGRNENHDQKNR